MEEYETEDEALEALCEELGLVNDDVVCSDSYTVDEGDAVSVYETQEECDADQDGSYAPRITHHRHELETVETAANSRGVDNRI